MIDLKNVIEQYPQSISSGKVLKSILLDLYPNEKLYGNLLSQILDDGIVEEIKAKDKIDVIEFINLCNKVENKHGTAKKYIEGCLTIWANAFDIPIKTKIEPIKKIVTPISQSESAIHSHKYTTTVVPPTCTEKGYTLHSCNCGYEYKDNFVNARHDYVLIEYTDPTCETDGKELYKCIHCGNEKTELVKAKGHKFGKWIEQEKPLCEKDGYEIRQCSVCGKIETNSISRTGHKFTAWRKEGDDYVRDCSACGFTEKKGLLIENVGQIFEFGRYPQTRNGERLPIKWRVIAIKEKKAFLLSECGLDKMPYDKNICESSPYSTRVKVTWSNSDVRRWLNGVFLNSGFTDTEKEKICKTENINYIYNITQKTIWTPKMSWSYDIQKNTSAKTEDYIFLPTLSDMEKIYSFKYDGKSRQNIERIKASSFCGNDIIYSEWVLRDLVYFKKYDTAFNNGSTGYYPISVYNGDIKVELNVDNHFLRPAMWVDLSTTEEKEQKLKEEQERRKLKEEQKAKQAQRERERAIKAAEEKRKSEALKAERREKGVCQYCGGEFKGWLIKKCSACGKRKDY